MVQREWQRVRLRGAPWWEGASFPQDRRRENPRAEAARIETEDQLTKLLADGWRIASVVGARPILLFQNRVSTFWQEAFQVFVERELSNEALRSVASRATCSETF